MSVRRRAIEALYSLYGDVSDRHSRSLRDLGVMNREEVALPGDDPVEAARIETRRKVEMEALDREVQRHHHDMITVQTVIDAYWFAHGDPEDPTRGDAYAFGSNKR